MEFPTKEMNGHNIWALERFMDDTRHMIEFTVISSDCPVGGALGQETRTFLTEQGYSNALDSQQRGDIKIHRHAAVIEGHLLYEQQKKNRHR